MRAIARFLIAVICAVICSGATAAPPSATTFDASRFLPTSEIPSHLADWVYHEQAVNDRFTGTIFAPLDHSELDPRFDPKARSVVLIGYIEIPRAKASVAVDMSLLPESARKVLFFERDGVEYVRLFVHPIMESRYADEAKIYGLKHGEFAATLSSSMRSWIIWNRKNPQQYIGEKTSVAVEVGSLDRKNDLDKLARAQAITQVTREIPAAARARIGFDLLVEPVTQSTASIKGGKTYGNITRVLPSMSHPNGRARYVPGFSLTSSGPNGELPLLAKMIASSDLPAEEYIAKKVIEPLVRSYAHLTFAHGIIGEPHQQNVLFELDPNGELTGRVLFRDLDAFKPDVELRHLRNLSDEPFLEAKRPYKLMKMAKAEHDYRRSYISYVKGAWSEAIEDMIAKSKGRVSKLSSVSDLPERFDKVLLKELSRHFGFTAVFDAANMAASEDIERLEWLRENKDPAFDENALVRAREALREGSLESFIANHGAKLASIVPEIEWTRRPLDLTLTQMEKVIDAFSVNELFSRNYANNPTTYIFDVNRVVEKYKALNVPKPQPGVSQSVLRREYERLVFNYRASSTQEVSQNGYFVLNRGSITAFSSTGHVIGHAFLEPRSVVNAESAYYGGVKFPRVEPNRAVLKRLYDFADGKLAAIGEIETHRYQYPGSEAAEGAGAVRSCSAMFAAGSK